MTRNDMVKPLSMPDRCSVITYLAHEGKGDLLKVAMDTHHPRVDMDKVDGRNQTALMRAAQQGQVLVTERILDGTYGAEVDVNLVDR